jgi:hypothetical protein
MSRTIDKSAAVAKFDTLTISPLARSISVLKPPDLINFNAVILFVNVFKPLTDYVVVKSTYLLSLSVFV